MALSAALQKLVSQGTNKYSRSTGERIKPKEGINRYRILLPDPDAQFWADLGVHWIKAEVEGKKPIAVVGCSDVVFQTPCDIDTAINEAIASAIDEDSKKLYESWKARKSVLLNVLDRSKGSADPDKVQILEVTTGTFGAILGQVQQYAEEGEDILDADEGMDIAITRTGKGLQTEYAVNVAAGKKHEPVTKQHLKDCHDLLDHIKKEFFRGDETKALNFISQTAQINVPALSSRTPTAALTSRAAQVDPDVDADALAAAEDLEEEVVEEKAPAKTTAAATRTSSKPVEKPVEADPVVLDDNDLDDVLADLDSI